MLKVGDAAPRFRHADADGKWIDLDDLLLTRRVLLLFLRYTGCPICQMRIGELIRDRLLFEEREAEVLLVVENTADILARYLEDRPIPFTILPDPDRRLYELFGVQAGGIGAMIAPRVLRRVVQATVRGYFHGKFAGSENQVPADFIIGRSGRLLYAHYGMDISDSTPNDALLKILDAKTTSPATGPAPTGSRRKARSRRSKADRSQSSG